MKHYDIEKIKLYKNNLLSEKESNLIEEHIYSCDECLDVYLSLIEEGDYLTDTFVDGFSNEILDKSYIKNELLDINEKEIGIVSGETLSIVKNEKEVSALVKVEKNEIQKNKHKVEKNFFIKYIAVAASIVLLTFSGQFTTKNINNIKNDKVNIDIEENIIYKGSNLLTNKLEDLLEKIETRQYVNAIN